MMFMFQRPKVYDEQVRGAHLFKIGYAGTDARTLVSAVTTSTATSDLNPDDRFLGVVIRGNAAMEEFTKRNSWPIKFIPSADNSVESYAEAIIKGLRENLLDCLVIMPEDLLYQGVVDKVTQAGFGERIIGLNSAAALAVEGNKISGKELSRAAGVPVADEWCVVDARSYTSVLEVCLAYLDRYGSAYLKYPFSAQGKGSRGILNTWEIKEVYNRLVDDYKKQYKERCGNGPWPLLIESRMSGVEISFTVLVDKLGNFQILPTALDYPERFEGPASPNNPITGGMGSISPHPLETPELLKMVEKTIIRPFVRVLQEKWILRPCVLYPGCFVSLDTSGKPTRIRVSEWNIRPGEPEFQVIAKRVRNLGLLLKATIEGKLDRIFPEVRNDQVSITIALVTGPGGPQNQKGYPWSCTIGEKIEIDFSYLRKKRLTAVPSAMDYNADDQTLRGNGSRPVYLLANATVKPSQKREEAAELLRRRLIATFDAGKIKMLPRENPEGNRFSLRRDIGLHYKIAETTFS